MQLIGTVGLASPCAESHSMRNGSASREICWGKAAAAIVASTLAHHAELLLQHLSKVVGRWNWAIKSKVIKEQSWKPE